MKKSLLLLVVLFVSALFAQNKPPFYDDVQTIQKFDALFEHPPHPIVFTGSSSIRKWTGLQLAFGGYNVLNRGIGGAVINDIDRYLDALVFAYEPRQIVLYVGENDLPDASATPDTILRRTVKLFTDIRAKLPNVPIAYISMKPSPSRDALQPKAKAANALIRAFLEKQPNTVYIDIFTPMIKDAKSRPELFTTDMLHMNAQGYAIWEAAVGPQLKR